MPALLRAQEILKTMKIRTKNWKLKKDFYNRWTVRWFVFDTDWLLWSNLSASIELSHFLGFWAGQSHFWCLLAKHFLQANISISSWHFFSCWISFHVSLSYFNNLREKSSHNRILVDTTRFANNSVINTLLCDGCKLTVAFQFNF